MQGGQLWRLLLPHIPNVQVAFNGRLFLFLLPLTHVLLVLSYFGQIGIAIILLEIEFLDLVHFIKVSPELAKLFAEERKGSIEFMVFFCSWLIFLYLCDFSVLLLCNFLLKTRKQL